MLTIYYHIPGMPIFESWKRPYFCCYCYWHRQYPWLKIILANWKSYKRCSLKKVAGHL